MTTEQHLSPVTAQDIVRGLLAIEDARIATGAFRPNAEAQKIIDDARAFLVAQLPASPVSAEDILADIVKHWNELKRDEGAFPPGDRRAAMSEQRLWHSIQNAKAWLKNPTIPAQLPASFDNVARVAKILQDFLSEKLSSSEATDAILALSINAQTTREQRKVPVMVPDRNSASGHRVEWLSIDVDSKISSLLDSATLPTPPAKTTPLPRWRHKKRGTTYTEIGRGFAQCVWAPIEEMTAVVIYQGADGLLWVRNAVEFDDGRFEPLDAALPSAPSAPPAPTVVTFEGVSQGPPIGPMGPNAGTGGMPPFTPSQLVPSTPSAPGGQGGPKLGDIVQMNETSPYFHDWRGVELKIVSLRIDPQGKLWASVIEKNDPRNTQHRGFGVYDGETTDFELDHLSLTSTVQNVIEKTEGGAS